MKKLLLNAISAETPIDIYFKVDNVIPPCVLFYEEFLVTQINKQKNTFLGFSAEERLKLPNERVLTEDSISAICKIIDINT